MELNNKKMSLDEFFQTRKEVLSTWKTGNDTSLNFENSIPYLKNVPDHKNFALKLVKAKEEGRTLVQPRAGVPVLEEHIKLLKYLESAGADFLPSTIDSYTRLNRYEEAERGIEESIKNNRAMLNGFPAVNHGVNSCKKVFESINIPVQARHGTPDARLLAEIIHASGWTSNEGGGISYNIPYAKNVSLESTIKYWQYCDRLVGFYEDHGISINREPFGPLTGTIVVPSISTTVAVIEALLAAEQGVKNITVGYGQGGNVIQDTAAIKALEQLTNEYLHRFGYRDVYVTTVFHQWMGGFPKDESEALGLISMSSTIAALSKATKMITKTPYESIGIPTKEANEMGIKASKYITNLLKDQSFTTNQALLEEIDAINKEVHCLMDNILYVGKGDLAKGVVEAFRAGIIDIPFAPSRYNAGKVLPARDNDGCIRILEFGNLGFNNEIKAFHHKKMQERATFENRPISFQMTVDDVYSVSNGALIGRKINK